MNKIFPTSTAHPTTGRVVTEAFGSPALPQAMLSMSLKPWDKGDLAFIVGQPATQASPGTQEGHLHPPGPQLSAQKPVSEAQYPQLATGWSQHSTSELRLGAEKGPFQQPLLS